MQVIKAGAEDLLTKPVAKDKLVQAIERALARGRRMREKHEQLDVLRTLVSHLTPRERQVFERVVRGKMNKEIARELGATERTIKAHRHRVMEKVEASVIGRACDDRRAPWRAGLGGRADNRKSQPAGRFGSRAQRSIAGPHPRVGLRDNRVRAPVRAASPARLRDEPLWPVANWIIVLDDDASVLGAVERVLKAHGFDAEVFDTVEGFLGGARLGDASCLVLDINLNGTSGIELKRQLTRAGVSLPVIFITGADNEATRKAALEAGCVAYLVKPFPSSALIEAIDKVG